MDTEWTKVQSRKRNKGDHTTVKDSTRGWNTDFVRAMKGKATTFFFTRFPNSWNEKALWEMFSRFGSVVDVYITSKRTKFGTRFGFVRFINVGNTLDLEQKLGEIRIGALKILVNIAKYDKGVKKCLKKKRSKMSSGGYSRKIKRKVRITSGDGRLERLMEKKNEKGLQNVGISYKDVMVGYQPNANHQKHMKDAVDIIEFQVNHDQIAQGMSIICEWSSQAVAEECLEKNKVNPGNWFSELVMWEENIESHGQITWLEIEGIPAVIWDLNTAWKIRKNWDPFLK
ncbi:nucleotide-binding alpha-beta plait domain-containing protein [Tanacetum coccineum]|uniref:Nucleotide-binding alpha-beta plait domain-containing protein n=1 Tax=Tanacetum coccineum TaxID=301880 RepID=A0ABQ5JGQ9_9ASTR